MICRVGIDDFRNDWAGLLEQIGISWNTVDFKENISVYNFPVIIYTHSSADSREQEIVKQFLNDGGSLMTEASAAKIIFGIKTVRRHIRFILPESAWTGHDITDINMRTKCAKHAEHVADQSEKQCVHIMKYLNGHVIILPDGLVSRRNSVRHALRYFYGNGGLYHPMELVSAVGKGGIRRLVQNGLMTLFQLKEIPFVRKSYMPYRLNPLLLFRMDTDFSTEEQLLRFYEIMGEHHIKASWFVEVKSQLNFIGVYRRFKDHEIAYHCYRHRTFSDPLKNIADFEQGLNTLRQLDIQPKGYAAPQGVWFPVLAETIERSGFEYSSEFSFAYDETPLYPNAGHNISSVLQVPVHPVSTGRLIQGRFSTEAMVSYFIRQLDWKMYMREPAVLYDHPAHGQYDVFKKVFEYARSRSFSNMSMLDYARWWKKRNAVGADIVFDGNLLCIETKNTDDTQALHVVFPDGTEYELPLAASTHDAGSLARHKQPRAVCPPVPPAGAITETGKKDLRLIYNQFLYHYRRMKQ